MTLNLSTSVLGFALLGQASYGLILGQLNSRCDGDQICRLYEGKNYTGDAWDICPQDIVSGQPINLKDDLGFSGTARSWKCWKDEFQYHFCSSPRMPEDVPYGMRYCVSQGGALLNPNNNPFGRTLWVWVRDHDEVPIGDDTGNMPPLTTYSKFGCQGMESVFYGGVEDTLSDDHYYLRMYGLAGARIPLGYHVEYYGGVDFSKVTDDTAMIRQEAESPNGGMLAGPGESTTCQNLDVNVWMSQPRSFCYCKDCEIGGVKKFGPKHCYCPGCNDCDRYPTSLPCDTCDIMDPALNTVETWLPCFCSVAEDQDFLDQCCELPIVDISIRAANPVCKPICDKFEDTPGCPQLETADCSNSPIF